MRSTDPLADPGTLTQDPRHGPRPLLLIALTVVTGLVDAVSDSMFFGGSSSAALVFHIGMSAALAVAVALLLVNAMAAYRLSSSNAAWAAAK